LVGGQRLNVLGDKTTFMTEVKTTWENNLFRIRIFHLGPWGRWGRFDYGGAIWLNLVMTAKRSEITKIGYERIWNI